MERYSQQQSPYFDEANSINLQELPRETAPGNLELCDDELFDELFPNHQKDQQQSHISGDYSVEYKPGPSLNEVTLRPAVSLPQQLSNMKMNQNQQMSNPVAMRPRNQLSESSAIERHMLYLMDQMPQTSQNQGRLGVVPKAEPGDSDCSLESVPRVSPRESQVLWLPKGPSTINRGRMSSSEESLQSDDDEDYSPAMTTTTKELVSSMIKAEPVDIEELTKKRSRRGRKRKSTESENELSLQYDRESNEYKKKRLRNNIAVRKSRDKAKQRQHVIQGKLLELADENKNQKHVIAKVKDDYDKLEGCYKEITNRLEEALKVNVRMRQFIADLPQHYQPKFSL